jgi:SAM-dependent methyltransferase
MTASHACPEIEVVAGGAPLKVETGMSTTVPHSRPALKSVLACPLCNSGRQSWDLNAETFGAGPYGRDLFSIYRCRECGIGITDPAPTEDDSHLLYEDRASSDFQGDDSSIAAILKKAVATRDVRTFVNGVKLRHPVPSMLDYACGNGAFAISMRRVFPDSIVWAADYHTEAPSMLKESEIRYAAYADLPARGPFDFILCRHVLEHTYHPLEFLRSMGDLMSPGGVLMIEVPNLEAPLRKVFGKYWDGYYAPYHPIHFSAAALRRAVVNAGLVPEKTGGCEKPKIGRSLRNLMRCDYNAALFAAGALLHPVQFGAGFLTREATCLRLWARKP